MRRITLLLSMIAVCCYAQIDKSKYQRQEHIKYNGKVYYSVHLNLADSMVTIPAEPENVVIRNPYYLGTDTWGGNGSFTPYTCPQGYYICANRATSRYL